MSSPRRAASVLLSLLALMLVAAVMFGSDFKVSEVLTLLTGGAGHGPREESLRMAIFGLRMPRAALMALVGMALGVCGATLQSCLQNPLADSSLLGVSSGASLGAVIAITLKLGARSPLWVPASAFMGALVTLLLVYLIAHSFGRPSAVALLLTGVALSSLSSALVSVLLLAGGEHRVEEIVAWLLGSVERCDWNDLWLAAPPILFGTVMLLTMRRSIDALALGEEQAQAVGVNVLRARALLFAWVALVAGCAVSLTGPIAFIGLIVPHMVRALTGPSARALLPNAAIGGAALLVGCDLIARVASVSVVVPVGVVTALLGVPFFLILLSRSS